MLFDVGNIYGMMARVWTGYSYFKRPTGTQPVLNKPMLAELELETGTDYLNLRKTPPMITVTGKKKIVSTEIAGRNYEVNEILGLSNYSISIKGFCVNPDTFDINGFKTFANISLSSTEFPEYELQTLIKICETNDSIRAICPLLNYFNIRDIVIESFTFPENEMFENAFAYEIQAKSDFPIEIEMID